MAEDKGTATRIVFTGGAEVTVDEVFEDVRDAIFFKTPAPDYVEFGGVAYERIGVSPAHIAYIAPAYRESNS
jgi:hypothetical protein